MIQKRLAILLTGSLLAGLLFGCASTREAEEMQAYATGPAYETVEAGTIENMGHPQMDKIVPAHEALNPASDEIVIYYLRNDGKYDPWGFWLWAVPAETERQSGIRTKKS